jgi:hypothetical protein
MLVSAAIAAYLPPLALVPHMETASRRPPRSRAVFAATKNTTKNRSSAYVSKSVTTHSRCSQIPRLQCHWKKFVGSGLRLSSHGEIIYYVRPTIQGVATGGVKKFVGSRHAEITIPMKKSYFQDLKHFSHDPRYELIRVPIRIRLGRLRRGAPWGWHKEQRYQQPQHLRSSQCRTHPRF